MHIVHFKIDESARRFGAYHAYGYNVSVRVRVGP